MTAMTHAELLKRLLPPEAYDLNAPILSAELYAEGRALDEAQRNADLILDEIDPRTARVTLADWERVLGLPDSCVVGAVQSVEQRQASIMAKWTMRGGQSRKFFIALAEKLGYPGATITEYQPATCNSTCNDALYSEGDRSVWTINLPSAGGIYYANCNSDCNAALASWGDAAVECAISKYRPADTVVKFAYL